MDNNDELRDEKYAYSNALSFFRAVTAKTRPQRDTHRSETQPQIIVREEPNPRSHLHLLLVSHPVGCDTKWEIAAQKKLDRVGPRSVIFNDITVLTPYRDTVMTPGLSWLVVGKWLIGAMVF